MSSEHANASDKPTDNAKSRKETGGIFVSTRIYHPNPPLEIEGGSITIRTAKGEAFGAPLGWFPMNHGGAQGPRWLLEKGCPGQR